MITQNRTVETEIMNSYKYSSLCPECGGKMRPVESCCEGGYEYRWYECCRSNCQGQWLSKRRVALF